MRERRKKIDKESLEIPEQFRVHDRFIKYASPLGLVRVRSRWATPQFIPSVNGEDTTVGAASTRQKLARPPLKTAIAKKKEREKKTKGQ